MFVGVFNSREARGTKLGDGVGTNIECSLGGTGTRWDAIGSGSRLCMLLLRSEVVCGLLLQCDFGNELLLGHCLHHLHLEELRLVRRVEAHGKLCLSEELLLLLHRLLMLEARGATIIKAGGQGGCIGVETAVLQGLATKVETITGIFVDGLRMSPGREARDIE
jgi:hypothetical protein